MQLDTQVLVSMTEANQNFSKVTRLVDESGMAVILKNNKPRYTVLDFDTYDQMVQTRKTLFQNAAGKFIAENHEALSELAK